MKPIPISRRNKIYQSNPDELIRVYTYQHKNVIEYLTNNSFISGNEKFVDVDMKAQYDWMRVQMNNMIPDYSGDYPIWATLKRPNPRSDFIPHRNMVRITAMVPRKRMVLSDYIKWNCILNGGYVNEEFEDYDGEPHETWHHCLDITRPYSPSFGDGNDIQACIDRIYQTEIVQIKY